MDSDKSLEELLKEPIKGLEPTQNQKDHIVQLIADYDSAVINIWNYVRDQVIDEAIKRCSACTDYDWGVNCPQRIMLLKGYKEEDEPKAV